MLLLQQIARIVAPLAGNATAHECNGERDAPAPSTEDALGGLLRVLGTLVTFDSGSQGGSGGAAGGSSSGISGGLPLTVPAAMGAQLADALVTLTSNPAGVRSDAAWSLAQALTELAIASLPAEPSQVDRTQVAGALALVVSGLMTDCARVDAVSGTLAHLLCQSARGTAAGEPAVALRAPLFTATPERTDLQAGASYVDASGSGASVTLTPAALAGYWRAQAPATMDTIDAQAAARPLTLDTTVIVYDPQVAACRQAAVAASGPASDAAAGTDSSNGGGGGSGGSVRSQAVDIKLTLSDCTPIDFGRLTGEVLFDMPVNDTGRLLPGACPGDPPINSTSLLECSWYDPVNRTYTTAGCRALGVVHKPTAGGGAGADVMQCACKHLTEFASTCRKRGGRRSSRVRRQ
jgi:hypothetical protein